MFTTVSYTKEAGLRAYFAYNYNGHRFALMEQSLVDVSLRTTQLYTHGEISREEKNMRKAKTVLKLILW